ncbi:MAG: hypothetical protein NWF00_08390 [Candidatus Bathyarchaeota archaeon]|nr:hypothetical protein [Candidatus Bathyarchaeota archaeon]
MDLGDLVREAYTEVTQRPFRYGYLVSWILKKGRTSDLMSIIKTSKITRVPLKKPYRGKKAIDRLENSDDLIKIATLMGSLGYMKEAQEVFDAMLFRTPLDTTALNNYAYVLLHEIIQSKGNYDKSKILIAQNKISKAATIDKVLNENFLILSTYKNLCLSRVVEAEYYAQIKAYLPAFLVAWLSIEMSIRRIYYQHLKEKQYGKDKLFSLKSLDLITEILYLNKCDSKFVNSKEVLESLYGLRNQLIHGTIFEVSEGQAKNCIELAYTFTLVKEEFDDFLTGSKLH